MRPIDRVLERLENVKPKGDKFTAICPNGHAKRSNSLLINDDSSGKVYIHCYDCQDTPGILSALGLTFSDLFPPSDPDERAKQRSDHRTKGRWNELAFAVLVLGMSGGAERRDDVGRLIRMMYGRGQSVTIRCGEGRDACVRIWNSITTRLHHKMLEPWDVEARHARGLANYIGRMK